MHPVQAEPTHGSAPAMTGTPIPGDAMVIAERTRIAAKGGHRQYGRKRSVSRHASCNVNTLRLPGSASGRRCRKVIT